jgi:hypothetical protein
MPHPIMTMLATGVPLTLLLDLQHPDGPDSQMIYLLEHPRPEPAASDTTPRTTAGSALEGSAVIPAVIGYRNGDAPQISLTPSANTPTGRSVGSGPSNAPTSAGPPHPSSGRTGPGGRRHAVLHGPGQLGEPEPGGDPDVSRRRAPDQIRDQALNTRPRIGGLGPPKDLVARAAR